MLKEFFSKMSGNKELLGDLFLLIMLIAVGLTTFTFSRNSGSDSQESQNPSSSTSMISSNSMSNSTSDISSNTNDAMYDDKEELNESIITVVSINNLDDIRFGSIQIGEYHYTLLADYRSLIDTAAEIKEVNETEYFQYKDNLINQTGLSWNVILSLNYSEQLNNGLISVRPKVFSSGEEAAKFASDFDGEISIGSEKEDWIAYTYFIKKYPAIDISMNISDENKSFIYKW